MFCPIRGVKECGRIQLKLCERNQFFLATATIIVACSARQPVPDNQSEINGCPFIPWNISTSEEEKGPRKRAAAEIIWLARSWKCQSSSQFVSVSVLFSDLKLDHVWYQDKSEAKHRPLQIKTVQLANISSIHHYGSRIDGRWYICMDCDNCFLPNIHSGTCELNYQKLILAFVSRFTRIFLAKWNLSSARTMKRKKNIRKYSKSYSTKW